MLISEVFVSRIGEGSFIGKEAIFIRLFGCSKGCEFCDTPQGNTDGFTLSDLSVEDLVVQAYDFRKEMSVSLVVLTGGEPGEQFSELNDLARELVNRDFTVHLETNGEHKGVLYSIFNHVTISPKSNNLAWDKIHTSRELELKFLHDPDNPEASVDLFNGVTQTFQQRYGYLPSIVVQIMDHEYTHEEILRHLHDLALSSFYEKRGVRLLPQLHKLIDLK